VYSPEWARLAGLGRKLTRHCYRLRPTKPPKRHARNERRSTVRIVVAVAEEALEVLDGAATLGVVDAMIGIEEE